MWCLKATGDINKILVFLVTSLPLLVFNNIFRARRGTEICVPGAKTLLCYCVVGLRHAHTPPPHAQRYEIKITCNSVRMSKTVDLF